MDNRNKYCKQNDERENWKWLPPTGYYWPLKKKYYVGLVGSPRAGKGKHSGACGRKYRRFVRGHRFSK